MHGGILPQPKAQDIMHLKPEPDSSPSAQPVPCGLQPFDSFETASRAVLSCLHERFGFGLWMMTRAEGSTGIILQTEDHSYDVPEGTVYNWADSFCSQMVIGNGPRVAPKAQEIPAYAAAPFGKTVQIGAYMGAPVRREDGTLFGTLCAIDKAPMDDSIREALPMVEMLARLLGTLLASDQKVIEQARLLEHRRQQAFTDRLTGLLNRRGWEQCIMNEEDRSRQYGCPASVMMIDLDELKYINDTKGHSAGDATIRLTANCLKETIDEMDFVARLGGDEFAILAIESDTQKSEDLYRRVTDALAASGINASVGMAKRDPASGLTAAQIAADRAMYDVKAARREARNGAQLSFLESANERMPIEVA